MPPSKKTISIISAAALVLGTAIPAFAIDVPAPGEQSGSGATTLKLLTDTSEYGGTEDLANPDLNNDDLGDNLAFTVPSALTFVVKANGDLMCPSSSVTFIQNESAYGIHVSSVDVDAASTWNLVADASAAAVTAANAVSMNAGPAMDSTEKISLASYTNKMSLANGETKWAMSAKGADQGKDQLHLALDGKAKNLTATLSSATDFATIHWYLTSGGNGVRYVDPATVHTMNKLSDSSDKGTFTLKTAKTGGEELSEGIAGDTVYIIAEPDTGCIVDDMAVTKESGDEVNVEMDSEDDNVGSFVMPDEEVDVDVVFSTIPPAIPTETTFSTTTLTQFHEIGEYLRSGDVSSDYIAQLQALIKKNKTVTVPLKSGSWSVMLVDASVERGLTFQSSKLWRQSSINSTSNSSNTWGTSTLQASMNSVDNPVSGGLYETYFQGTELASLVHPVTNTSYVRGGGTDSSVDCFWIPSGNNIFGAGWRCPTGGSGGWGSFSDGDGDTQFYYYSYKTLSSAQNYSNSALKYKYTSGASSRDGIWWTRSRGQDATTEYMIVDANGCWSSSDMTNSSYMFILPCFCL